MLMHVSYYYQQPLSGMPNSLFLFLYLVLVWGQNVAYLWVKLIDVHF